MTPLVDRIFDEISKIRLIDPHTHIDPLSPSSRSLNDILGYHYYTELAHSAGLPKDQLESVTGVEFARLLVKSLDRCANTVQYSWLVEIARTLFGFEGERLTEEDVEPVFAEAERRLADPSWTDRLFEAGGFDAVFLTNDFDDPLEGFDCSRYVPCLRTDDLVFKLDQPAVQDRLRQRTGKEVTAITGALDLLFEHFSAHQARAAAISLPPDFEPIRPEAEAFQHSLDRMARQRASDEDRRTAASGVFMEIADRCEAYSLPFDLMIGVRRNVYENGVHQGRDLFDQRTSLDQYRRLFNEKAKVTFPVSVLTHGQNQELASFAWIFPNVVTSGHWWYSNVPIYIEADLRARLEAVPWSKQIAYYSDAYKMEFVQPKFNMYRRSLARVLAEEFVVGRGWSEERAVELARAVLRTNVESIFGSPAESA